MADSSEYLPGNEFQLSRSGYAVTTPPVVADHRSLLGISKRGDPYLRTVLIHGARAVMTHSKAPPEWARQVAERRPKNVAIVALANKMARTI